MSQTGIGVLIQRLWGGNRLTKEQADSVIGQSILDLALTDNELRLSLSSGETLTLWDDGQSCCESRYMTTDDDLSAYRGTELRDIEVSPGPDVEDEYGECHETEFLRIITHRGTITFVNHNQHNGYYGGISLAARLN